MSKELEGYKMALNYCLLKNLILAIVILIGLFITESAWCLLGFIFCTSPSYGKEKEQDND